MRVVGVDVDDRSAEFGRFVALYYTAPQRVDFRALLHDLAASLKARIDLRQIGSRDAARMIGGLGTCGRELCCSTFLPALPAIGMRMVKDQDLAGNLLQVQGACGRLKCCLSYEQDLYTDFEARAPALGCQVDTPDGSGRVVARSVPCDSVTVRGGDGQRRTCPVALVSISSPRVSGSQDKTALRRSDAD
jgi:cell fate regulator YaaT (PSP1 superfamily)